MKKLIERLDNWFMGLNELIDKDDCIMTMEDFIESVRDYEFMDDDGHGYYASSTHVTKRVILPSEVLYRKPLKGYTHVVWLNK